MIYNVFMLVVLFFAAYGILTASIDIGRWTARISMAIDELLYQRKQRKKL